VRILLDECCHRRIVRALAGLHVTTVQAEGWRAVRNGDLLRRIGDHFDVFVTQDQNLPRQNLLARRTFGVIVLKTKGGRWHELEPLMPRLRETIGRIERGAVVVIGD
jgi:hypothetical protein